MLRWTSLAIACGVALAALAGCERYGGTYVCTDHVDSSVDTMAFSGGKVTVTNYHVPGDKAEGPYKVSGDTFTATIKDAQVRGRFDGKGGVEVYGQTCKKK
jgi:ABC-type glycerol-3-phosphate transport system substrate-binding protein